MQSHFAHYYNIHFIHKQISTTGLFLSPNCNHRLMGLTHQAHFDRRNVLVTTKKGCKIEGYGVQA